MPTITLCRAMCMRAVRSGSASTTRSMRSTMITASAVSEATVAPAVPIAIPTSARASAGASLMPSPTMTTGRSAGVCADRAHDLELVLRRLLRVDASTPICAPSSSATACRSPETIATWRTPGGRRRSTSAAASGRTRSPSTQRAGERAVDADEDLRLPGRRPASSARDRLGAHVAARVQPTPRLPTATRRPSTLAFDALATALRDVLRLGEPEAACARRADERLGHDVDGVAGRPTRPAAATRRRAGPVERDDAFELRMPARHVPGLVEQHRSRPRRAARSTPPPLTITPRRAARETPEISAIGAARISGHGVATTSTATARTASPEAAQAIPAASRAPREEDSGVAVGHADERRALGLGVRDEAHDRRRRRSPRPAASRAARTHRRRSPCRFAPRSPAA